MATANSTRRRAAAKADYPLYLHGSGQWAKTVLGKKYYFGTDKQAALELWLDQKDDLIAGRKPRKKDPDGITVKYVVNFTLTEKKKLIAQGRLSERHYADLVRAGQMLVDEFGRDRPVTDVAPRDFRDLRAKMAKKWSPASLRREIANIRTLLNYAYHEDEIQQPVKFGKTFNVRADELRKSQDSVDRQFGREQIVEIINNSGVHLRAMVLLACNCGIGNSDLSQMEMRHVDLERGWLDYDRRKTGIARRAKLWPETVDALKASLDARPKPLKKAHATLLFITKRKAPWGDPNSRDCPISKEFSKVVRKLDMYQRGKSFYSLRHVYRTQADNVKDEPAVNVTMGHHDGKVSSIYRKGRDIADERLEAVAAHVRTWLFGSEG